MVILIADIIAAGITWPSFVIGLFVIALALIGLGLMASHDNRNNNKLTEDMIPDKIAEILRHECTIEYRPTGTMEWTSDPSLGDRISEARCKLHPEVRERRWTGEKDVYFRNRVTEWWDMHRADIAVEAFEAGKKFGAEIMKEKPPAKVPTSELEQVWIQYHYDTHGMAVMVQSAKSPKEIIKKNTNPNDPWYSYDIKYPGKGHAGDLINEQGPFYFGSLPAPEVES